MASFRETIHSSILGRGHQSVTVTTLSLRFSKQNFGDPSFVGEETIGLAHSILTGLWTSVWSIFVFLLHLNVSLLGLCGTGRCGPGVCRWTSGKFGILPCSCGRRVPFTGPRIGTVAVGPSPLFLVIVRKVDLVWPVFCGRYFIFLSDHFIFAIC